MKVSETEIPGVLLIEPDVYADARGHFLETFRAERYEAAGIPTAFVQDSLACSRRGVLRGLHFQAPKAQGKLVHVVSGEVFDVAVDLRRDSPTHARWTAHRLSSDNQLQLYIPPGFAHGFVVTSDEALFLYKATEAYDPDGQRAIRWNDPDLGIEWPIDEPILSDADANAPLLRELAS